MRLVFSPQVRDTHTLTADLGVAQAQRTTCRACTLLNFYNNVNLQVEVLTTSDRGLISRDSARITRAPSGLTPPLRAATSATSRGAP